MKCIKRTVLSVCNLNVKVGLPSNFLVIDLFILKIDLPNFCLFISFCFVLTKLMDYDILYESQGNDAKI